MKTEERIAQIEQEIARLKSEKRALKGFMQLNILNAEKLVYPVVCGNWSKTSQRVEKRYMPPSTLANVVRMILTPDYRFKNDKSKVECTYPKLLKDLSKTEYEAICRCTEECIEVIDKYNRELHPYGIAEGHYTKGQSLYKEVTNENQ